MATPKQVDFFRELLEQGRQGGAMTAKVAGDPVGASVGDMWEAIQELINASASAEQRKGQDEAYTPFNPADTKKTMPWLKSRADELDKSRKEKWAKQSEIYNAETGKLIATQEYQSLDKQAGCFSDDDDRKAWNIRRNSNGMISNKAFERAVKEIMKKEGWIKNDQ